MSEENVPYGERCHLGCGRRAVVRDTEYSQKCARCYMATLKHSAGPISSRAREEVEALR